MIANITAQAEDAKKMHVGQQLLDPLVSEEEVNKRIEKALKLKAYYDSNPIKKSPADEEVITEEVEETEPKPLFGKYANQIKDIKIP